MHLNAFLKCIFDFTGKNVRVMGFKRTWTARSWDGNEMVTEQKRYPLQKKRNGEIFLFDLILRKICLNVDKTIFMRKCIDGTLKIMILSPFSCHGDSQ